MNSTMRDVKLDRDSPLDLHEQVAAKIRRAIAHGEAKPGERLPPAKDLAHVIGVNTNTVLRALRELRDEGLLEFRRGRGVTVTGTPQHSVLVERARELLHYARTHGYRTDELIDVIQQLG
jgi:GntR family transcriptional regulator